MFDVISVNAQEAMLAWQGLFFQAGVMDNIKILEKLIWILFMFGFVWTALRFGITEETLVSLGSYTLVALILYFGLMARVDMNVKFYEPPEQENSIKTKPSVNVNAIFALTVGLINKVEHTAIEMVGKAISIDSVARNTDSIAQAVAEAMSIKLEDGTGIEGISSAYKKTRKMMTRFLDDGFNKKEESGGKTEVREFVGCRKIFDRSLKLADDEEYPLRDRAWRGALEATIHKNGKPFFDEFDEYQAMLDNYAEKNPNMRDNVEKCKRLPEEIRMALYETYQNLLSEKDRDYNVERSRLETMGNTFGGGAEFLDDSTTAEAKLGSGLFARFARKEMMKELVVQRSYKMTGKVTQALTDIEEKFGMPAGVKKMMYAIRFMPYARGVIKVILYTIFPLVWIFALLPNGLKWLGQYYKMIFAVSLWSLVDVIIVGMTDDVMMNQILKSAAFMQGINFSPEALIWAQGVAMMIAPMFSYAIVGSAMGGALSGSATGGGPGAAGLVSGIVGKGVSRILR